MMEAIGNAINAAAATLKAMKELKSKTEEIKLTTEENEKLIRAFEDKAMPDVFGANWDSISELNSSRVYQFRCADIIDAGHEDKLKAVLAVNLSPARLGQIPATFDLIYNVKSGFGEEWNLVFRDMIFKFGQPIQSVDSDGSRRIAFSRPPAIRNPGRVTMAQVETLSPDELSELFKLQNKPPAPPPPTVSPLAPVKRKFEFDGPEPPKTEEPAQPMPPWDVRGLKYAEVLCPLCGKKFNEFVNVGVIQLLCGDCSRSAPYVPTYMDLY